MWLVAGCFGFHRMATNHQIDLSLSVPAELHKALEEAAVQSGQSLKDFAVVALTEKARDVIEEQVITRLSRRDRETFLALLDDVDAKPTPALARAAKKYKKRIR